MNDYNYQIVCYSKESDWEQVIRRGLDETAAHEMLAEFNASSAKCGSRNLEGYYVTRENEK